MLLLRLVAPFCQFERNFHKTHVRRHANSRCGLHVSVRYILLQHTFGLSPQPVANPSYLPLWLLLRHRLLPLAPAEHLAVAAVARLPNSNDRQINFQENIYRKIDLTCHASMLEEQPSEAARRSIQAKQPVPICDFGQRCGHR